MAQQPMNVKPYLKHMESYNNFSGGLNTVTSNDNLQNNEFPNLTNIDLGDRGSLKRRHGMKKVLEGVGSGKAQGYFRYYKEDGTYEDIQAVGGKLYKNSIELPITNLVSFQTERMIEAVQFQGSLWIATGTKLVEYNGTEAKVVEPYKPQPLEALYIGTNGLADNPDAYLTDGTATFLRVEGVRPDKRYGVSNQPTVFNIYVSKPTTGTVEYKMEYRTSGSTDSWQVAKDWSTEKSPSYTFRSVGTYEIKFSVRMQGETTVEESYIPQYTVNTTDENQVLAHDTMHDCNRIVLHWGRIILYGDPTQPDVIYISHLNNPRYIPIPYSLRFENERQEGLTTLVPFRNVLVAFTPTGIQGLYGKAPIGEDPYRRVVLSNSIGCIAPESAKVMGNYVTFLSQEGVHILKTLAYSEDRMNVEKIDTRIDNIIPRHTDASATVVNMQYHLTFPQTNQRFRFYYEQGVWTKDESPKLDFVRMFDWDGECYGFSFNGVFRFDPTVWDDDGEIYEDYVKFKDYDFDYPYNPKKLKELQLLLAHQPQVVNLSVFVYADDALIINPDTSHVHVDEEGYVHWIQESAPNLEMRAGTTLGAWEMGKDAFGTPSNQVHKIKISGKCRRTRVEIRHKEATPNQLLGVAFIFKLKSP
jgi:hypothetical protein